jgi:hypothetical protein
MDVTPPGVRISIDELVLDGVEPSDPLVADAVQRALAPVVAGAGLPPSWSPTTAGAVAGAVTRGGQP